MRELFGPPGGGGGADGDGGGGGGGGGRPGPRMIAVGLAALAAGVGIAVIALGHDDGGGIDNAGAQVTTATVDGGSDRTPPTIVISRPRSGEQVTAGSRVAASYACNDGGKPAKLCEGTVADGAPIATTEGDHQFRVRARDAAGNEETVVVRYSAVAGRTTTTTTTTKVTRATIDIRSPADGRTYPADTRITADFSCTPADPCRADVAPGAAVPADPGPHDFTVTAADSDGSPRTATASYTVQAPPDPGPPAPSADPAPGTYAAVDVTYACTGGTAPVTCSATLDGKPFTSGAAVPCNTHTIVVTAQDARHGATSKSFTYTVDGDQCTVIR
jgi:hypothetical protein